MIDKSIISMANALLEKINFTVEITDEVSKQAYLLYIRLGDNRPSYRTHSSVRAKVIQANEQGDTSLEKVDVDFFSHRQRIEYLIEWTVNILPVTALLKDFGALPVDYSNGNFHEFLSTLLSNYIEKLQHLPNNPIVDAEDISNTMFLTTSITTSISHYLEGDPAQAFDNINAAMDLLNVKFDLTSLITDMKDRARDLYKMRIGTNEVFSSNDMFHIPFEKRGIVRSNRYSIPGLPCVYLGSTPLICWEEMGRPDLNTVQTSLFLAKDNLTFLDISLPPIAVIEHIQFIFQQKYGEDLTQLYNDLKTYIVLWPLIAACSIRVKNHSDTFKPEYIIPQLLLQWIRRSPQYDGICYFSTKIDQYNSYNVSYFRNYALPVKERKKEGYCEDLRNKFHEITSAVPWQFFQIHKGTPETVPNEAKVHANIELVKGIQLPYLSTDFSRLETFLISTLKA
jgi:hypothetical protein